MATLYTVKVIVPEDSDIDCKYLQDIILDALTDRGIPASVPLPINDYMPD